MRQPLHNLLQPFVRNLARCFAAALRDGKLRDLGHTIAAATQ